MFYEGILGFIIRDRNTLYPLKNPTPLGVGVSGRTKKKKISRRSQDVIEYTNGDLAIVYSEETLDRRRYMNSWELLQEVLTQMDCVIVGERRTPHYDTLWVIQNMYLNKKYIIDMAAEVDMLYRYGKTYISPEN